MVCAGLAQATQVFSDGIRVPFLQVGSQGTGGVTYFNGTMINNTTKANNEGNPLTMGDDVRIDGVIFRTEVGGSNPLKFSDSIRPTLDAIYSVGDSSFRFKDANFSGTLTAGTIATTTLNGSGIITTDNIADQAVTSAKIADSTITSADLADESVTSAKIPIRSISQMSQAYAVTTDTTTETVTDKISDAQSILTTNTGGIVFICFSGVFANDANGGQTRAWLVLDGSHTSQTHTVRRGHSASGGKTFTLAFNSIIGGLKPGEHIFEVGWNTDGGTTSTVYNYTLDVVELKR